MTLLGSEHSLLIRSKFRSVLQLRLQQRRTREQLADQGIMPPLKSPAAFHEQRKNLERAKTEDYLKHKIRSRPEKADLVSMHILQDTAAEGTLQATQMKLKRARLADDLNEKIAQRPGPLELVKKNIIPVDSAVKEAIDVGQVNFPKAPDTFSFEEDSSNDALSPEQPRSHESQGSENSPSEPKFTESSSPLATTTIQYLPHLSQQCDLNRPTPNKHISHPGSQNQLNGQITMPIPVPAIVKTKPSADGKNQRHKKPKDTKPKVKKLKYHQYIPPDQKPEKSPPPMDSAYARLLQQQQLFLQLQILSQQQHHQQHHYNYQNIHPSTLKQPGEQLSRNTCNSTTPVPGSNQSPVRSTLSGQTTGSPLKPGPLPSNLDDLKAPKGQESQHQNGSPQFQQQLQQHIIRQQILRKMNVPNSANQTGPKFVLSPTPFCSSNPTLSKIKQPPSYEDAVKQFNLVYLQQMSRSQMDDLLDVLIESGEMPPNAKNDHCAQKSVPQIAVSSGASTVTVPRSSSSPFNHMSPPQLSFDHCASNSDNQLEALLNSRSSLSRGSDLALLKIGSEDSQLDNMAEGFCGNSREDMLNTRDILENPLSPMQTQMSPSPTHGHVMNLGLTETPLENMDWLDLTPPSSAAGFGSAGSSTPSIFSADFLDVTDLNLNTTMNLQW
uniref:myocardin isoform X9 n=1 Tax=Pristiophorus japonicus TaxID=55135 RepID=UPI00398E5ED9